eukprot:TRINITY_DN2401_c0_g2_i1.p1 TRINITY_DN2401_c0_g2~~TRINITY_DN2401_c0_g2_i1.p1  ORF type:complete len:382 (+),score=105.58 TRINITY_DN2401_c0_g2_i1:120-1265(+)
MSQLSRRHLTPDELAQHAIERRRRAEEQRRIIILDPHKRQIGIDKDAIEAQKQEKERLKEAERRRDEEFNRYLSEERRMLDLREQERNEFRRRQLESVYAYRTVNQGFQTRREFDLNDPNQLKKSLPARVSDDDPRLGPSSVQKFSGEDIQKSERVKSQRDQVRVWIEEQTKEKTERKVAEKELERKYREQEDAIVDESLWIEGELERRRTNAHKETKEFNKHQVEEKRTRDKTARVIETEQSIAEIQATLKSDLMTENPAQAIHSWNPRRIVPYHYKGMSPSEVDEILREQERQRLEKQKQKEKEIEEKREWERLQEALRREAVLKEREKQRAQKIQLESQKDDFAKSAKEKKERFVLLLLDLSLLFVFFRCMHFLFSYD